MFKINKRQGKKGFKKPVEPQDLSMFVDPED